MIKFWILETVMSIRKAQASFILSVISTTIAVLLIITSIMVVYLTEKFNNDVKEKMSLNIFLLDDLSDSGRKEIETELSGKKYVKRYLYRSKEDAAEKFIAETGEDFTRILDYNPLPASFEISIRKDYVVKDSLEKIKAELNLLPGIDQIYFSAEIYYRIINLLNNVKVYILGITALLLIVSVYLVFSTNRLILHQRIDEMNTMKLIGATIMSIKMPVILNSVFIGIISGGLSLLVFSIIRNYLTIIGRIPEDTYSLIFIPAFFLGPALGVFTSIISMRRVTIKI